MLDRLRDMAKELDGILGELADRHSGTLAAISGAVAASLGSGGKILIFGNGGSAAEAQHFAAEMVGGFLGNRRPIPAVALTADTSALTAIGNDYSFDSVFARQVEALGREGDVAIALTTSGKSLNVIEGLKAAKKKRMISIAFTGAGGIASGPHSAHKNRKGKTRSLGREADHLIAVPSTSTARIQEAHLVLLHLLAEEIEKRFGT